MQVAIAADSVLARDRIVNTLYFNAALGMDTDGADTLCADLATIYHTNWLQGVAHEINVRAYEVKTGPDGPPIGSHTKNLGIAPPAGRPREVALCLSYFATHNRPRSRGRIYLPPLGHTMAGRPTDAALQAAIALVPKFAALGGADINWVVHSRVSNTNPGVTNAWVDDEWDTQRSRGLRSTKRLTAVTSG